MSIAAMTEAPTRSSNNMDRPSPPSFDGAFIAQGRDGLTLGAVETRVPRHQKSASLAVRPTAKRCEASSSLA